METVTGGSGVGREAREMLTLYLHLHAHLEMPFTVALWGWLDCLMGLGNAILMDGSIVNYLALFSLLLSGLIHNVFLRQLLMWKWRNGEYLESAKKQPMLLLLLPAWMLDASHRISSATWLKDKIGS